MAPEARRAVARGRAGSGARTDHSHSRQDDVAPRSWGSVARRGARVVGEPAEGSASRVWRETVDRDRHAPPAWEPEVWVEVPPEAAPAPERRPAPAPRTRQRATRNSRGSRLPPPVKDELGRADRRLAPKLEQRLAEAVRAYEHDRYQDARRILRSLVEVAPAAAAVRELYGLTLYRMNRWSEAIKELELFHSLAGSFDQHPVMMDSYRALKRWRRVEDLWTDLKEASPAAEIVAEGRIVAAGALADRGRLAEAVHVLERAPADVKRPKLHHLRTWYALADLNERAGEIPRARALFTTVLRQDAEFADVAERLAALD
jgi:tetratricopeptide (TPR) repeat protein